jgi:molybdenum cofactor cytidylyltransferase
MNFREAFGIEKGDVVAFIGAGGKTSLMVGIGYELAEAGWRVLATTTARMPEEQLGLVPAALPVSTDPAKISRALTQNKFVLLYDRIVRGIAIGPSPDVVARMLDVVDSDVMLVEADYAANLPVKAPRSGEPAIPPGTSLVIPVASFAAVGQPLDDRHVYNAQAMIERCSFPEGAPIKPSWIAQVVRDSDLGMSGVPPHVRTVAFFNQSPMTPYNRVRARIAAKIALRHSSLQAVALGEVRGLEPVREVQRPVGAIVLAAGMSSRMGEHKLLLPWRDNRTIIEHIVEQLIKSRVDPIVVVTGHQAKEVKAKLDQWDVQVVHNKTYQSGDMLTSLKVGLAALPESTTAALLVLGDQPSLQPKVINKVLLAYAEHQHDLVIPSYQMRRGHPVLLGRRYWADLKALPNSATPRQLYDMHADRIHYVNVDNDSILRDIDTKQDYERERKLDGADRDRRKK